MHARLQVQLQAQYDHASVAPQWSCGPACHVVGIRMCRNRRIQVQGINNGMTAAGLQGVSWRKSVYSNPSGNCVELAELSDGGIAVRNSRHPSGPALIYTRAEMAAFISGAQSGEFNDLLEQR